MFQMLDAPKFQMLAWCLLDSWNASLKHRILCTTYIPSFNSVQSQIADKMRSWMDGPTNQPSHYGMKWGSFETKLTSFHVLFFFYGFSLPPPSQRPPGGQPSPSLLAGAGMATLRAGLAKTPKFWKKTKKMFFFFKKRLFSYLFYKLFFYKLPNHEI